MLASVTSKDEPPNEMKGSVSPVYGSELVVTPMLTSA